MDPRERVACYANAQRNPRALRYGQPLTREAAGRLNLALALLLIGERTLPGRPVALMVVALSIGIRLVVCDLSTSPFVDLAGARMLGSLSDELAKQNIPLRVTDAHASVRDLLRAEGVDEKVGGINRFASVADVVDHYLAESTRAGHRPWRESQ